MLTVDYDRLGARPGELLLDLGAGNGRHAYEAYRRGIRVVAADFNHGDMVECRTMCAAMEAVALGVKDDRLGQAVLLVARPFGEQADARLSAYLKAELPGYMQPREIRLLDELPRNPNGKLDRAAIRREHGA